MSRMPPFKVVCTSNGQWCFKKRVFFSLFIKNVDVRCGPKHDEICTVIGKHMGEDGFLYYNLKEFPNDPNNEGWEADCFYELNKKQHQ